MDQENIMLLKNDGKSYTMVDLYLNDRFFGYKDSYNYYDYIIRYNNVNKMTVVPLQLKNNNFSANYMH